MLMAVLVMGNSMLTPYLVSTALSLLLTVEHCNHESWHNEILLDVILGRDCTSDREWLRRVAATSARLGSTLSPMSSFLSDPKSYLSPAASGSRVVVTTTPVTLWIDF